MARFTSSGFDSLIDRVGKLRDGSSEVIGKMIQAGSEEIKKAWVNEAGKYDFDDSGDMIRSIGYASKPSTVNGVQQNQIYPQGKDRKGVRNAEKAFILHYGTSRIRKTKIRRKLKKFPGPGIPPTHWVDEAEDKAAEPALEAMEQVYNKELEEKGMT